MKLGKIFYILISFFICAAGFFITSFFIDQKKTVHKSFADVSSASDEISQQDSEITLFFVGDIMLDRGAEYMVKTKGRNDWRFPFLKIEADLQKADILFGNLEGTISDKGTKIGTVNSFKFPPAAIEGLKSASFDVLSLANNHTFDYDLAALGQTMEILKENGIVYVGAGADKAEAFGHKIIEVKGKKIAFLAFTDFGAPWWTATDSRLGIGFITDINQAVEAVKTAGKEADFVVVSFHSGTEYTQEASLNQVKFARQCINSGADLVIGHHPHVVQPLEHYNNGWIAYSLGNFVFDQNFSRETMTGRLLEVIIKGSEIQEVKPREIEMNEFFQPELKGETF